MSLKLKNPAEFEKLQKLVGGVILAVKPAEDWDAGIALVIAPTKSGILVPDLKSTLLEIGFSECEGDVQLDDEVIATEKYYAYAGETP